MEQIDPKMMEQYLKAVEAEAMNNAISQSDGVTIYQSEPTAPGVYVSTEQQAQDAYNDMLLQRQAAACPAVTATAPLSRAGRHVDGQPQLQV